MNDFLKRQTTILVVVLFAVLVLGYVIQMLLVSPADKRYAEVFRDQWYAEHGEYPTAADYKNN